MDLLNWHECFESYKVYSLLEMYYITFNPPSENGQYLIGLPDGIIFRTQKIIWKPCFLPQLYSRAGIFEQIGGQEPSRNRVLVRARQATEAGGIDSLESISGLHKSLKISPQTVWNKVKN
jgi:hypothetical protein